MTPEEALRFIDPETLRPTWSDPDKYILDTESGVSLRAAGWRCIGQAGGLRWSGKRRPEVDLCPAQMKMRFEKEADGK